jgi:catechol 2,3-dioxygenase-like lactoylglutathione lyase family enzyme
VELLASNPVLAVADLDRSAAWYVDVLGCARSDPDPGNWAFLRSGNVTFHLGRCPDALPASDIGDHNYVAYLTTDDVDAVHARARAAGADVRKPPTDEPWGRRELALRTPDGHRLMVSSAPRSAGVAGAMAVTDAFLATFNDRDAAGHAATLAYPHVRLASGQVRIWQTAEEATGQMETGMELLTSRAGWHHSEWDHRRVIHDDPAKVHLDVQFTRYRQDGSVIGVYPAVYVIVPVDGAWRIQSRSSFAP